MKIKIKLTLVFLMAIGVAKAQQKPIVAVCDPGKGCTFQVSKLSPKEVDATLGNTGK